jgi:hypothetical protein
LRLLVSPERSVVGRTGASRVGGYKMWDYSLFSRGIQSLPVTIRQLQQGDSQTVDNVEILLGNEDVVKRALDQIPPLLGVLRSFGGDEIIEYPRSID